MNTAQKLFVLFCALAFGPALLLSAEPVAPGVQPPSSISARVDKIVEGIENLKEKNAELKAQVEKLTHDLAETQRVLLAVIGQRNQLATQLMDVNAQVQLMQPGPASSSVPSPDPTPPKK